MSDSEDKEDDGPSLEERQKDHKFLTTEEAQAWNKARGLRPLSPKHWMVKAARVKRMLILAVNWKRLAQKQHKQIRSLQAMVREQEQEILQFRNQGKKRK